MLCEVNLYAFSIGSIGSGIHGLKGFVQGCLIDQLFLGEFWHFSVCHWLNKEKRWQTKRLLQTFLSEFMQRLHISDQFAWFSFNYIFCHLQWLTGKFTF